jgi:hypothetical protein
MYVKDKTNGTATESASDYVDINTVAIPSGYADAQNGSWTSGFFADMYQMRGYIFGFGIGIALFLSFFYLYFLRIPGVLFTMIWTILIGKHCDLNRLLISLFCVPCTLG